MSIAARKTIILFVAVVVQATINACWEIFGVAIATWFIIVSVMMMTESGKVHRNQGRLRVDLLILTKTKLQSLVYPMQTASLEQEKSWKLIFGRILRGWGNTGEGLEGVIDLRRAQGRWGQIRRKLSNVCFESSFVTRTTGREWGAGWWNTGEAWLSGVPGVCMTRRPWKACKRKLYHSFV